MPREKIKKLEGMTEYEWINKGLLMVDDKNFEEAIRCYGKALKINPMNSSTWNKIGLACFDLGDYDEALNCYNNALKLEPEDEAILSNVAFVFHYLGDYENAIKYLDNSLKINSKNPVTLGNKGIALYHLGKYKDAILCYEKALAIYPKMKNLQKRIDKAREKLKLELARGYEEAKNYDKAIELYEEQELWSNAGRCRELKRKESLEELGAKQSKIEIERIEKIGDSVNTTISDSVIQRSMIGHPKQKIFKICPYCGEKLNLAEPPKFCPYCEKRILR